MDHRRWAFPFELLRLPAAAAILAAWLPPHSPWLAALTTSLALAVALSWICLFTYRRQFDGKPRLPSRAIGISTPRTRPSLATDETLMKHG